jgi:hypothetical protein
VAAQPGVALGQMGVAAGPEAIRLLRTVAWLLKVGLLRA